MGAVMGRTPAWWVRTRSHKGRSICRAARGGRSALIWLKDTATKKRGAGFCRRSTICARYRARGVTWLQDEEVLEPPPGAPKREKPEGSGRSLNQKPGTTRNRKPETRDQRLGTRVCVAGARRCMRRSKSARIWRSSARMAAVSSRVVRYSLSNAMTWGRVPRRRRAAAAAARSAIPVANPGNYSGTGRVEGSTDSENHENTKMRKHEKGNPGTRA